MSGENACIVLFVRFPEKGAVKTRLAPLLDGEDLVALYHAFVADLLATLEKCGYPFRIAFTPAEREADMVRLFGRYELFPQAGPDLGVRMGNAFRRCFSAGFDRVVLIGSDIPDLPPEILTESLAALDGHDAVIGPALDGGYYLIGFRRETFRPEAFAEIVWGTGEVCIRTRERLSRMGSRVRLLAPWRDVDTPEDLRDLVRRSRGSPFARSQTMAWLAVRCAPDAWGTPPRDLQP